MTTSARRDSICGMRLIESRPEISQREFAKELGVSLGKVNYCLGP